MEAQTLAHPGLRGNGIASQAWWKHTSFARMGADTTFAEASHTLDAMSEAGIDSMILPDLQPAADAPLPFAPRFGTQDDLDALLREASARRMHVVIGMPVTRLSAGGDEVRFWMSRGIAGFDAGTVSAGDLSVLRGVRSAMQRFPGERILLARTPDSAPRPTGAQRDPVTLHLTADPERDPAKASLQPDDAVQVKSLDDPAVTSLSRPSLIFDSALLQQAGGALKVHAALARRSVHPRSRTR